MGRAHALRRLSFRYTLIPAVLDDDGYPLCYYCGMRSTVVDHAPSLAYAEMYDETDQDVKFRLIPACAECNGLLGSSHLWRLDERKRFLKQKLGKRYWKILAADGWSEPELEEFGPNLASSVREFERQRLVIKARMKW